MKTINMFTKDLESLGSGNYQVSKIATKNGKEGISGTRMNETFYGTLKLQTFETGEIILIVGNYPMGELTMHTSAIVSTEPCDSGILVHTLNSTYLVEKADDTLKDD